MGLIGESEQRTSSTSFRTERRAHKREMQVSEHLLVSAKSLGVEAVQDVFNAVRFATDPELSGMSVAVGIATELDDDETQLLDKLLKDTRKIGPDGVVRAFSRYTMVLDQITQLELQHSPDRIV